MRDLTFIWEESPDNAFTVRALIHGQTVGIACGHWNDRTCELEWVNIVANWQRHGVGTSLVRQVQCHFRHITACPINSAGVALVRHCGFTPSPESTVDWTWSEDPALTSDRDF